MGCPGATIVFEELIQLGVTRLLRVGTCGGLQPTHALGDLIVAISAVPADSTAMHSSATSRTARPRAGSSCTAPSTWRRRPERRCTSARSPPATSSTTRTWSSTSAGRSAACSESRWRRRRSSPWRAARGAFGSCSPSATSSSRASSRGSPTTSSAPVDRMTRIALAGDERLAMMERQRPPRRTPSGVVCAADPRGADPRWMTVFREPARRTGRPGGAGRDRPHSCRASHRRHAPLEAPGQLSSSRPAPPLTVPRCSSSSVATGRSTRS